jgi:hypothetical protein
MAVRDELFVQAGADRKGKKEKVWKFLVEFV